MQPKEIENKFPIILQKIAKKHSTNKPELTIQKHLQSLKNTENVSLFEKAIKHNKLAALMLSAKSFEKAQKHFEMALIVSDQSGILFSNPIMNLGNLFCQQKKYSLAAACFELLICVSPQRWIQHFQKSEMSYNFLFLEKELGNIENLINKNYELSLSDFEKDFPRFLNLYLSEKLNSKQAYIDAHSNLGFTLLELGKPELALPVLTKTLSFQKGNREAHINVGTALRQAGRQKEAIQMVWNLLREEIRANKPPEEAEKLIQRLKGIDLSMKENPENSEINDPDLFCFYCVKWGSKYGPDYVNKLYNGVKKYFPYEFIFFCLTEDPSGLNSDIICLDLDPSLHTWWTKACLFSKTFADNVKIPEIEQKIKQSKHRLNFYIDLDVIITGDLSFMTKFKGVFGILNTADIYCEVNTSDCYNSSVVIWRGDSISPVYDLLKDAGEFVRKFLFRFDFWLEMTVPKASILQTQFAGKIRDFKQDCEETVPEGTSIVIFPRNPKPHECEQKWVKEFWV